MVNKISLFKNAFNKAATLLFESTKNSRVSECIFPKAESFIGDAFVSNISKEKVASSVETLIASHTKAHNVNMAIVGGIEDSPMMMSSINQMDKQFKELPKLEKDLIVYRGISKHPCLEQFNGEFNAIDSAKIGDSIHPHQGYSFAAYNEGVTNPYAKQIGVEGMVIEIRTPKGSQVSHDPIGGAEVLFPRNAEYRILSKSKDESGFHRVIMEYILPKI